MAFDLDAINKLLEQALQNPFGKILFSPFVVLGGPLLCYLIHIRSVFSIRLENRPGAIGVSFSLLGKLHSFLLIGFSLGLLALLVSYVFVENFVILPRH